MRIIRLKRSQYEIAKGLGVPIRPLTKKEKMQLEQNHKPNAWLIVLLVAWLLLIVSIIVWK